MRHAAEARKKLKTRTLFNCLGPLTNPAGANHQLIGVYEKRLVKIFAEALQGLGCKHGIVVHGEEGLDEVSLTGKTNISELEKGNIRQYNVCPEDFGLKSVSIEELKSKDPESSVRDAMGILKGETGPKTDFAILNAAFALKAGDRCPTIEEGISLVRESIGSGLVLGKIEQIKMIAERVTQKP